MTRHAVVARHFCFARPLAKVVRLESGEELPLRIAWDRNDLPPGRDKLCKFLVVRLSSPPATPCSIELSGTSMAAAFRFQRASAIRLRSEALEALCTLVRGQGLLSGVRVRRLSGSLVKPLRIFVGTLCGRVS